MFLCFVSSPRPGWDVLMAILKNIHSRQTNRVLRGKSYPTRAHMLWIFFLDPFPRAFPPKPCKYYVKTPWNTAFLLCNPSFMFTLVSMINQISLSIMIIDCLCVSSQMNNRVSQMIFTFFVSKKADLNMNQTKIRLSWLFFFESKN